MEKIRTVVFQPYLKGKGPRFTLVLYDTFQSKDGKCRLAYELRETGKATPIFEGADFYASPLNAIDSDETVKSLMSFLTLQPGDTDREYFINYTKEQLDFSLDHAEALKTEVYNRFGE